MTLAAAAAAFRVKGLGGKGWERERKEDEKERKWTEGENRVILIDYGSMPVATKFADKPQAMIRHVKTVVYTHVNGDMQRLTHRKLQKS